MTAVALVIKASVILVVVSVTATAAARVRAAIRHLLFTAAFVALLILPFATRVVPPRPLHLRVGQVEIARPIISLIRPLEVPRFTSDLPRRATSIESQSWRVWLSFTIILELFWA